MPHRRIGKLIVANGADQAWSLEELLRRGLANGVEGLCLLGRRQTQALEPEVRATASLWSPTTGIVDSHALAASLELLAVSRGAVISCRHQVTGIDRSAGGYRVSFGPGNHVASKFVELSMLTGDGRVKT